MNSEADARLADATCCALTTADGEFGDCGAPATHRSQYGRPYCAVHAANRAEYGQKIYRIQQDRPDPRGGALILRVVRHHLSRSVTRTILGRAWKGAADILCETAGVIVALPVVLVLTVIALGWVLVCVPVELIRSLCAACLRPAKARMAFRIMDGLPPNTPRSTTEGKP